VWRSRTVRPVGEAGEARLAEAPPPENASVAEAQSDAAEIVRLAFAQAERINAHAQDARNEAARLLEEANKEAAEILEGVRAERDRLLTEANRDRVAAEEAVLQARTEAEREAEVVIQRATELARREAEILLDGSRMELLRARDEAAAIRAAAERDAESIVAAATQRARTTSAELLAATRRRLGESTPAASGESPAPDVPRTPEPVAGVADDRPPPVVVFRERIEPVAHLAAAAAVLDLTDPPSAVLDLTDPVPTEVGVVEPGPAVKLGGWAIALEGPHAPTRMIMFADRRYRMNWERMPTDEDVEVLVRQAVSKAVARSFARRRRRRAGSNSRH
jgi:F0F1-type ATP synthase membrane subunit b/b'